MIKISITWLDFNTVIMRVSDDYAVIWPYKPFLALMDKLMACIINKLYEAIWSVGE